MYGRILPIMSSIVRTGVVINSSRLPRSRSRTIATAVNSTIVKLKITPIRAGTIMTAERRSGLKNVRTANSESSPATGAPGRVRNGIETSGSTTLATLGSVPSTSNCAAARLGSASRRSKSRGMWMPTTIWFVRIAFCSSCGDVKVATISTIWVAARSSISHRDACVPASSTTPARRCRTSRLIA